MKISGSVIVMRKVVLTRIDDRLIHGQVLSGWIPHVRANSIIIIDDEIAKNKLMSRVLATSVEDSIKLKVYSTNKAVQALAGDPKFPKERILILTKSPLPILELIESGYSIPSINLGGMGMHENRQPYFRNISCTKDEENALQQLNEKGVEIYYQLVPEQAKIDFSSFKK